VSLHLLLTQPLQYLAHRIVGRGLDLQQAASESWIIEPESNDIVPPAIFLEDGLERITGVGAFSTLAYQLKTIRGGPVIHRAIRAFKLKNAALLEGNLYAPAMRVLLHERCPRFSPRMLYADWLPAASLAATHYGSLFFGHWLTDDLPLALLGAQFAPPIATQRPLTAHQRDYLHGAQILLKTYSAVSVDELIIIDDRGETPSKRHRYAILRERFCAGISNPRPHPGVFLLRGSSGQKRVLTNEGAIAEALGARGYKVMHPESHSVASLMRELSGAAIVIGVEGSHLLHALFAMPAGAAFLVLQPPDRFSTAIKAYADALGFHYGFVVGYAHQDGFTVQLPDVLKTLDLLAGNKARVHAS
jgi:hypothetical protein